MWLQMQVSWSLVPCGAAGVLLLGVVYEFNSISAGIYYLSLVSKGSLGQFG
jgi:hypothetical protein